MRLVGKPPKTTIQQIREADGTGNSASLSPLDPVTLGLCSQIDLDLEVQRSAKDRPATSVGEVRPERCCRPTSRPTRGHQPPEEEDYGGYGAQPPPARWRSAPRPIRSSPSSKNLKGPEDEEREN